MRRSWAIALIGAVGMAALGATAAWYAYQGQHYVVSSYAEVRAPYAWIKAQALESVDRVAVPTGRQVNRGQTLMIMKTPAGNLVRIPSPMNGTVGPVVVAVGAQVVAGQPLAAVVDLHRMTVTAQIPETSAPHVSVGQTVDITFAAHPNSPVMGRVEHIGRATLQQLSNLPQIGPFSKQQQWVSVVIQFDRQGLGLVAGESASVRIHI